MFCINLIIFCSFLSSSFSVRPFTIRFLSYTFEYMDEFYQTLTINLMNHSDIPVFNGSMIFRKDLANFDLNMRVMVNDKSKRRPWKLFEINLDVCQLIGGESKRSLSLINSIVKNLKSVGQMVPDKCPYKKGIEYHLENFYLDAEFFPFRLPYMSANVFFILSQRKVKFYKSTIGVVVEESKKLRKRS